jgi:NitT/TauT family transport system substrate-binding protein
MLGGDVQIAAAAPSAAVDAGLSGGDLVTVAGMVNIAAFYLVVRPEIKSLQDLRGHPVGVTRYGASTDFAMRYLLRKSGLEPDKDVPILQLGGQIELAAAIESGRIFGVTTGPPAMVKMERSGARVLVSPRSIGLRFPPRWHCCTESLCSPQSGHSQKISPSLCRRGRISFAR